MTTGVVVGLTAVRSLSTRPGMCRNAGSPHGPGAWAAVPALGVAGVIAGWGGVAVMGVALGLRYALRGQRWQRLSVVCSAGGLILAGAALSRQPWRSADGYAGHSASVQLLALISLAVLAASVVAVPERAQGPRND